MAIFYRLKYLLPLLCKLSGMHLAKTGKLAYISTGNKCFFSGTGEPVNRMES